MSQFRRRILWLLGIIAVTIFISLGIIIGQLFQRFYTESFVNRLQNETVLVKELASTLDYEDPNSQKFIERYAEHLNSRITVVNPDMSIVSDADANGIEEVYFRDRLRSLLNRMSKDNIVYDVEREERVAYFITPLNNAAFPEAGLVLSVSLQSIEGFTNQLWMILGICMGMAFLLVLILGIRLIHRFTRPIEDATVVAIELAKGNYRARTYERYDETGNLSRSINQLARNLETMTNQTEMQNQRLLTIVENMGSALLLIDERGIVQYANRQFIERMNHKQDELVNQLYYRGIRYKEIVRTIEEIFMTECQVDRDTNITIGIDRRNFHIYGSPILGSRDEWKGIVIVFHDITELKRLENMRKDFLANVSHELKTPITSIKGFSETLLDGALEDAELSEQFLGIILKESDRMSALIGELLELSKIEQPDFSLDIQKIVVQELLTDTLAVITPRLEQKEQRIEVQDGSTTPFYADYHRMQQILLNLLTNAVNYSHEGTQIKLIVTEVKDVIRFEIVDNGPGIPKEEIPRIFERFYRLDKARSRNSGGTGLGLSIVKHLVDAHDGKISVESIVGRGTTFKIEVPKVAR
ncbi:MAG: two-component system histidine kinase PnpS [Bacilli bacterium]